LRKEAVGGKGRDKLGGGIKGCRISKTGEMQTSGFNLLPNLERRRQQMREGKLEQKAREKRRRTEEK